VSPGDERRKTRKSPSTVANLDGTQLETDKEWLVEVQIAAQTAGSTTIESVPRARTLSHHDAGTGSKKMSLQASVPSCL
jgi:hypothetical protein